MQVNLRQIKGPWLDGWVLDKHTISSTFLGNDDHGHPQFETLRTEIGEATYLLKYRQDWTKVDILANALAEHIYPRFQDVGLIVSMPPSRPRPRQPVPEVAAALGKIVKVPVFNNILYKSGAAIALKDLHSKEEKLTALKSTIQLNEAITNAGAWNALIIDDLYDSGASLEAACDALSRYKKIKDIYVAALTWK
jgi:predicted amidophosphoribosyltransferase